MSLLVATIGTTIAPWMIFLAQNNVVDKNIREDGIVLQRIDTATGSIIACAIAWFIIVTTGAVLHPAGIEVADAADAGLALEPIAGEFSTILFAPPGRRQLPGRLRAAGRHLQRYLRGVRLGARRGPQLEEAPIYRGLITAIFIVASALLVIMPGVDLFQIMMSAQVINGVLLPILLVFPGLHRPGQAHHGQVSQWTSMGRPYWGTIVLITVLTVVMFGLQANGNAAFL